MKFRSYLACAALLGSVTIASAIPAGPASAATAVPCSARMSNARPKDYTTTYVDVSSWGGVKVTTVAHYKTTTTTHHATTNGLGKAAVAYYISGATPGYRVVVAVTTLKSGHTNGHCSTSFIPQR